LTATLVSLPAVRVAERQRDVEGLRVNGLEATESPDWAPVLYVHGVPNGSEMWRPFLERTGGFAPDLPGFGRSAKPAAFDYSIAGFERFLEAFVGQLGLDRLSLVVHDWGAAALGLAQRRPELIDRLVIIAGVPLLAGYRWHTIARVWRTPLLGELAMGFTFRWGLKQVSRAGSGDGRPLPGAFLDEAWRHFDHGTQRAILKLYRSAPPDVLARSGRDLGAVTAPALVIWGERDPFLPNAFAARYADALGGHAEVRVLERAGHWPWLDRPELVGEVSSFLTAARPG